MQFKNALIAVLAGAVVLSIFVNSCERRRHNADIVKLQNEIARRDQTIEIKTGLYVKQSQDVKDLRDLLDAKDVQLGELQKQLKSAKQELVGLTTEVLRWKKAYEGAAQANQSTTTDNGTKRDRVDFKKDFGIIATDGYTLTNPAFAYVRVQQVKPLKLSMAIARDKQGRYYAYATSSDENIQVEIESTGIDSQAFAEKWYQKIGIVSSVAGGDMVDAHLGLTYRVGRFDLGPTIGISVDSQNRASRSYGLMLNWHPFAN